MDEHLRAGLAVYNAGYVHAAHDAWEDYWLDLSTGTDDERFLRGLIQFTAAVHHARAGNWPGATGLAESARGYLAGLPADYRGVNVGEVRDWLGRLGHDPELVEREQPLELHYEEEALDLDDLEFPAVGIAAEVLAEPFGYDEAVIDRAAAYAEQDLADEHPTSPFVSLVFDLVRGNDRDVVFRRLAEHVERRNRRQSDVEGLFDGVDEAGREGDTE